ncbi:unnamed protein product [Rhizophagus irregularis]|uniref:Protein kinase domain-containing protein n=1 Tax=Rhizophagus irregularis TaxID=588596 RepID=A0A916EH57_9GLOM|nr:unnamed protein product [Rhizophagus irregularis]
MINFGVIMAELSSGKPPFYKRKHDTTLALEICEEIKVLFEEANKEIPNISTSYEKNPDAIYTSRLFTFNNLTKPINSSLITSYLDDDEENNKDCQDSQLFDLEVSSSLQLKDE